MSTTSGKCYRHLYFRRYTTIEVLFITLLQIIKVLLPLVLTFFFLDNYDFINTMWESLSFTYIDNMELSIADYLIEVQSLITLGTKLYLGNYSELFQ
jgi:hypothetical protein